MSRYIKSTLAVLLGACLLAAASVNAADTNNNDQNQTAALDARQPLIFKQLTAQKDADGDFLVDEFETALINKFAPYLIFHPQETVWPSSVTHHLSSILQMRMYDKDEQNEYKVDSRKPKPATWADVMNVYQRKCANHAYKPEDLYFALPIDKSMLKPGDPLPACPANDFRYERTGAKSIADVYKARMMIPSHRPVNVDVEIIEEGGDRYTGSCTLNIFSSDDEIQDEIKTEFFDTTCDSKKRQVQLQISGIRTALGLDGGTPLPNGPVLDWSKAEVLAATRSNRLEATFIRRQDSSRSKWLKDGKKLSAYFSVGAVCEPELDLKAISAIWQTKVPNPTGGAEVYAHVYPTANYVIIQYWMFYGYSDHERELHEGDWGDHIDVVLYRNDPEGSATNATSKPLGVIPAYRKSQALSRRMVALVAFYGSCGRIVFKRDQDTPTNIVESRSKFSPTTVKQLRWCGDSGLIAAGSTHPVVYVAKGSHQMYHKGGQHSRSAPANKFKKIWKLVTKASDGTDYCATDSTNNRFSGENNPVRVLPQLTAKAYSGQASYEVGDKTVTLNSTGTSIKLLNVGELTAMYREALMRYDGKICKELTNAWGHKLKAQSEADAIRDDEIRAIYKKELQELIKTTLAQIKEEEAAKQTTTGTTTKKKSLKVKAEERVKQIKAKIWKEILDAKRVVKKTHSGVLETTLNDLVVEVIQDVLGINPIKPLLILSKTKPMSGGSFLDYPGRWGRLLGTAEMSPLERQQAKNYLSYELPDDDQMRMLRKWRWSGPVGPAGAKPQRYLKEFYRDYDAFAKDVLVYGVEIDL